MKARILHTADWQIGKQFARIAGDAGALLRRQRFDTVENIAAMASQEQVDAVLVAGDVFDSNAISDDSLRRTMNALTGFSGPWVLLPGNHDAAQAQSVWTRLRHLEIVPENVILATSPQGIELPGGNLWILPAPLQRRHEIRDLTEYFDGAETPDGALRVGLAHGSVTNRLPEKAEAMNPVAEDRAETARLDYLALGDWHGTLEIANRTWYCGTPEQDRFKQNSPGNVLLVALQSGKPPEVETRRVGRFDWTILEHHFESDEGLDLLKQKLDGIERPSDALIDMRFSGTLDLEGRRLLEDVIEDARARFHFFDVDDRQLRAAPSQEDIATMGATGFLADTLSQLVAIQEDSGHPDHENATRALRILYFEQQSLKRRRP